MPTEARKLHVIEEVLKAKDEASLVEVESFLKRKNTDRKKENKPKGRTSDYAGCISKETAKALLRSCDV